ncbi:VOC family protein [Halobacillus sp. A1]|uniref:VOC family protein n=1 Tax=Halobacillus sp. A1 TaxID=2880262 RepID=UPI0020A6672B|nr:VOC family protein [Halobacillus sp. A1]MCP3031735.1 VOC family protein [Halobacillus sp. A1]
MNRVHLITLGVKDMRRSVKFYRDELGFPTNEKADDPEIIFFNTPGSKISLYALESLAEDINKADPPERGGFPGVTLAFNAKSEQEVDEVMARAEAAGARIVKAPEKVFWGGYSGYFTDPDGYYWEVAYGEMWEFDENDMLIIS